MIRAIELQNFKCVQAAQRIDIRPLTLLFGPNSSGKSTVLDGVRFLHSMLHDAAADRTELGIDAADQARVRNATADSGSPSVIRVDIVTPPVVLHADDYSQTYREVQAVINHANGEVGVGVRWGCPLWHVSSVAVELRFNSRTAIVLPPLCDLAADTLIPIVVDATHPSVRSLVPRAWIRAAKRRPQDADAQGGGGTWGSECALAAAFDEKAVLLDALVDTSLQRVYKVSGDAQLGALLRDHVGRGASIRSPGSTIADIRLHVERWSPLDRKQASASAAALSRLLTQMPKQIAAACSGSYVGPHRRLTDVSIRTVRDGDAVLLTCADDRSETRRLASLIGPRVPGPFHFGDNSDLSDLGVVASRWMSDPLRLDLGVGLEVVTTVEIATEESVRRSIRDLHCDSAVRFRQELAELGPTTYQIRLRTCEGNSRRFSEVGEGIGCVLPVVAEALTCTGPLYIEQPELHLHPRVEARLADLFIYGLWLWKSPASTVRDICELNLDIECSACRVIETHSEHLVLRVLRRIREGTAEPAEVDVWKDEIARMSGEFDDHYYHGHHYEGTEFSPFETPSDLGPWLRPDQVRVVYAERTPAGTVYRTLRISDDGRFLDPWPHGFFPERREELR